MMTPMQGWGWDDGWGDWGDDPNTMGGWGNPWRRRRRQRRFPNSGKLDKFGKFPSGKSGWGKSPWGKSPWGQPGWGKSGWGKSPWGK